MLSAEQLVPGALVDGLADGGPVEIRSVTWVGDAAMVTFADALGFSVDRLLLPEDFRALSAATVQSPHSLDAEPGDFRLALQALRLRYTYLIDPLMAVSTSNIEPLPHQVQAVYDEMLTRRPLRYLLADDPGAGKTIMAGLYIRETMARGWVQRCLIVAPGGLVEQWQEELQLKFGLRFEIFDRTMLKKGTVNPLEELPRLIIRVDQFARDLQLRSTIRNGAYDLAVVDEAHKMTANYWGGSLRKSKRYELGELVRDSCANVLLMTATPHNGKEEDFQLFLRLLDADRFVGRARHHDGGVRVADIMRRLVKEQLRHADGRPLFPPRHASSVAYEMAGAERRLYEEVSDYVRHEMNKVGPDERRRPVGFALLVLQRRLASSPEAIMRSLVRRRDRLREQLQQARAREAPIGAEQRELLRGAQGLEDDDELLPAEVERIEDDVVAGATAARTVEELEAEVLILESLVARATEVRDAGVDRKWEALAGLLESPTMYDAAGHRMKILIFTEHRDTLDYLERRIVDLLGAAAGIEVIHGGTSRGDRRMAQWRFRQDPRCTVLLATDAAGEGVNLQQAHLMVNYDIPWNPNRLEQRFGRIHRIGQTEECQLWNLVARETREGDVFETLLNKLETQRKALGDKVFDVLGEVLTGHDLRDLLTQALQGSVDSEAVRAAVDQKVGADLEEAVAAREQLLSELTDKDLLQLRELMSYSAGRRIQPADLEEFVQESMARLRGDVRVGPNGRCRVVHVPEQVRDWSGSSMGSVQRRYDALAFGRDAIQLDGGSPAELLAPGHPLLDGLVGVVLETYGVALLRGVTLSDEAADTPYFVSLFLLRVTRPEDDSVLSEHLLAIRVAGEGVTVDDPLRLFELPICMTGAGVPGVDSALERAREHIVAQVGPAHASETGKRRWLAHDARTRALEHRVVSEVARLRERLARALDRDGETPEAVAFRRAIEGLNRRLDAQREAGTASGEVVARPPLLLAVASVVPG